MLGLKALMSCLYELPHNCRMPVKTWSQAGCPCNYYISISFAATSQVLTTMTQSLKSVSFKFQSHPLPPSLLPPSILLPHSPLLYTHTVTKGRKMLVRDVLGFLPVCKVWTCAWRIFDYGHLENCSNDTKTSAPNSPQACRGEEGVASNLGRIG